MKELRALNMPITERIINRTCREDRWTFKRMEHFIRNVDGADQYMADYHTLRDAYGYMKVWAWLRTILREGRTKVIALSATPQAVRERFGDLCRDVPFDHSDLMRLETFASIPYNSKVKTSSCGRKAKRELWTRFQDEPGCYAESVHHNPINQH